MNKIRLFNAIGDINILKVFYDTVKDANEIKLNVLISYPYLAGQATELIDLRDVGYTNKNNKNCKIEKIFLDSGAYSVNQGRFDITVDEYRFYLMLYGNKFDQVLSFDNTFDNIENNLFNQLMLEEEYDENADRLLEHKSKQNLDFNKMKTAIPVVHDKKYPLQEFETYAGLGHKYIAIGSDQQPDEDDWEKIQEIRRAKKIRIHMLGTFNLDMLKKQRPDSADSATYAIKPKFGGISYWDGQQVHFIYLDERSKPPPTLNEECCYHNIIKKKPELKSFLKDTFGYTLANLVESSEAKQIVNLYFIHQLEEYLNDSIEERNVPEKTKKQ